MNIDDEESKRHFEQFVRTFLRDWRRHRWLQLLETDPDKWDIVGVDELWKPGYAKEGKVQRYKGSIEQLLAASRFNALSRKRVFVFRLGHDPQPGLRVIRLEELPIEDPLEAIVSILPGRIALALGHSGEVAIIGEGDPDRR